MLKGYSWKPVVNTVNTLNAAFHQGLHLLLTLKHSSETGIHHNLEIQMCNPLKSIMDSSIIIALLCLEKSIRLLYKGLIPYPIKRHL